MLVCSVARGAGCSVVRGARRVCTARGIARRLGWFVRSAGSQTCSQCLLQFRSQWLLTVLSYLQCLPQCLFAVCACCAGLQWLLTSCSQCLCEGLLAVPVAVSFAVLAGFARRVATLLAVVARYAGSQCLLAASLAVCARWVRQRMRLQCLLAGWARWVYLQGVLQKQGLFTVVAGVRLQNLQTASSRRQAAEVCSALAVVARCVCARSVTRRVCSQGLPAVSARRVCLQCCSQCVRAVVARSACSQGFARCVRLQGAFPVCARGVHSQCLLTVCARRVCSQGVFNVGARWVCSQCLLAVAVRSVRLLCLQ